MGKESFDRIEFQHSMKGEFLPLNIFEKIREYLINLGINLTKNNVVITNIETWEE